MNLGRRGFLKGLVGGFAFLARGTPISFASGYRVGFGSEANPYAATLQAVEASGEWPAESLRGRTVVIKPNLVHPSPADTGTTTDPEVVRALVDLALRDGATRVRIVEHLGDDSHLTACGYDVFANYDPDGRVEIVNLKNAEERLVFVPYGLAYARLYLPEVVLDENVFLISAGKMKTHAPALASLSMKNLFGLPLESRYHDWRPYGRFGMHVRGVHQAIVDLNLARPIDFAVVDGVWALEGNGPVLGEPVRMDTIVAGRNAVAVDRSCLQVMGIPQMGVQHITLASQRLLGPQGLGEIQVHGTPPAPRSFALPLVPPTIGNLWVYPRLYRPRDRTSAWILYWLWPPGGPVRVSIVRASPHTPELVHIRAIQDWTWRNAGIHFLPWDGRDDQDEIVPNPGYYAVQVEAKSSWGNPMSYYSIEPVYVLP